MVPSLTTLADEKTRHWRSLVDPVAEQLGLTPEDLDEVLPSGEQRVQDRLSWALSHLFQAGALVRPKRGHVQINVRGLKLLADHPNRIDATILKQFEEYREFLARTKEKTGTTAGGQITLGSSQSDDTDGITSTPLESIGAAVRQSNEDLATKLLDRVYQQEPAFLERLVLQLLTAMGYGGRAGAAEHIGRSGDGGVDGVVRQDVLGLDRVYVQAKRYARDSTVGRPDIQAFVGALHGMQADRGVFITTSRFSTGAQEFVDRIPSRIVLIDGKRLAELMILHNVGVQDERTFILKRIDEDFFPE
jgi:restriction system protein